MPNRHYSNTAVATSLVADLTSLATSMSVGSSNGWPPVPFSAQIDRTVAGKAEIVDVTAVAGNVWTVVRGAGGTTSQVHTAGASVVHSTDARDFAEAAAHRGSGHFARYFLFGGS